MPYIECCNKRRFCDAYRIENIEGVVLNDAYYLEACPVCGHTVLLIKRFCYDGSISIVRKTNEKARKLAEKLRSTIICQHIPKVVIGGSSYFLRYNHYGCVKKCFSNLSSLNIGLFESLDLPKIPQKLPVPIALLSV